MSNFEDDFNEDDYDQPASETNPVRARMKQLEKEAKELRKQVAEFAVTQRELAFAKAGIDPASPQAKYFVKGYDGDLTPEAIRAAAEEAQLITPQPVQVDPDRQHGSSPIGLPLEPRLLLKDHLGLNESGTHRQQKKFPTFLQRHKPRALTLVNQTPL
jgi:hypothetical protein